MCLFCTCSVLSSVPSLFSSGEPMRCFLPSPCSRAVLLAPLAQLSKLLCALEAGTADVFLVFFSKLQVPNIVKALHKQLKEKSIKSRQGCFSLLTELANVLPGCLADHVPALVPGKLVRGLVVKEQAWLNPFLTHMLLACVFQFYSYTLPLLSISTYMSSSALCRCVKQLPAQSWLLSTTKSRDENIEFTSAVPRRDAFRRISSSLL